MTWQSLGSVTPNPLLWLPFPGDSGDGAVFRLQFVSTGNIENIFSFLLFRRIWKSGVFREKEVELTRKLYPQVNSVILWLPIPPELKYAGISPAGYECRLERRYQKGNYAEPSFYVSLDVFLE